MSGTGKTQKNVWKRALGLTIGLSPLALLFASIAVGIMDEGRPPFDGAGFMIPATAIAVLNFHLSFIRPRLFLKASGSMDGYKHVSGFPAVGTILVVLGVLFGFGAMGTATLGLAAMSLDTGGSVWFLIATWHDDSLWDS